MANDRAIFESAYASHMDHADRLCRGPACQGPHAGNNLMGFFLTAILGIAGALIATHLGQWAVWYAAGVGAGFIASVIGAIVLLALAQMVMKKR